MVFFPFHISSLLSLIVLAVDNHSVTASKKFRPDHFTITARTKQHVYGKDGAVREGEEDKRAIILHWDKIPGADRYEICHNCCNIDDATGKGNTNVGEVHYVGVDMDKYEYEGNPYHVIRNAPLGYNKFHLRVFLDGKWSLWSDYRNFLVDDEVGHVEHREL